MSFDLKAKDWDLDPSKVERAQLMAERIQALVSIPPQARALEFGCGTGLVSFCMYQAFGSIHMADTSAGMLEVLSQKIANHGITHMHPVQIDLTSEKMQVQDFDMIYTMLTMHHVYELEKAMQEFASMLKPGGKLCIADLVTEDGSFHASDMHFDGHLGFSREQVEQLYTQAGLQIEHYEVFHTISRTHGTTTQHYPLFLVIGSK